MYAKISIITLLFFVTTLSPYSPAINKDRSKREGNFVFPPITSALTPARPTVPRPASARPPRPQKKQAASNSSHEEASSTDISPSEVLSPKRPLFVHPLPPRKKAEGAPSRPTRRRKGPSRARLSKTTKPLRAPRYEDLDENSAATIIQKNYRNYRRNKSTRDVVAMRKIAQQERERAQREKKIAQRKNDRLSEQLSEVESNLVGKHALELFGHKKKILELETKLKELATSMAPTD